jgi:hypothetical protein
MVLTVGGDNDGQAMPLPPATADTGSHFTA